MLRLCGLVTALSLATTAAFAQTAEREPNNTLATANSATLGGKVTGTLRYRPGDPGDDPVDWWVLSVNAGQTIFVDVDADESGSALDAIVGLYGSDGTTELARSDNWDGLDPYVAYAAPASGTYYVKIATGPGPYSAQPYTINFLEVKCAAGDESEPNNDVATAKPITVNQSIHAVSCPAGDVDFYRLQVAAGTKLEIQMDTVGRERPAFGCACSIAAGFRLYASDGSTVLAEAHDYDSPKRVSYTTSSAGTYYIGASIWPGGIRYPYTLRVGSGSSGNANPHVLRAEGLGSPVAVIADPYGDFIVSDSAGQQVWWATTDGRKQVIAHDEINVDQRLPEMTPTGLGWDVFGNLLITTQRIIFKLSPKSVVSVLISIDDITAVALAPDGTIWLAGGHEPTVRQLDQRGHWLGAVSWMESNGEGSPHLIAATQTGQIYFVTDTASGSRIYKVDGTHAYTGMPSQFMFAVPFNASGLALDVDANLYFTSEQDGAVYKYSSTGAALASPFASGLDRPTGITFGRNQDGSMNNRLFVVERGGRLVELNGAGVAQRGAPIGFATATQATADLLRPGALTDAQRRVLDQVGNKNGRYDVGDLRAFLIQTTTLSP